METVTLARYAMATRFEIVLQGEDESALRAAGEEALDEIEKLDAQLSFYNPASQISRINALAAREPVKVEPQLFELLRRARDLSAALDGAFDITIAPLMKCWGLAGGEGRLPSEEELVSARERVGMHHVILDQEKDTVRFEREGMALDLGSIGKGYALESAVELLRDLEIESAFIHGGTSTACAIGRPVDSEAWTVAIEHPRYSELAACDPNGLSEADRARATLTTVALRDEAMSVSAIWGKAFEIDGRTYGHVMDPRRGEPTEGAVLAAVVTPSATDSDALATGLLTLGAEGLPLLGKIAPKARALAAERGETTGDYEFHVRGLELG
ncbi:MAG: thiamine biosynthesis lipoprotein [Candidatus Binatia bacterium]|jgi:thiamine biosynthesis lipoprotein